MSATLRYRLTVAGRVVLDELVAEDAEPLDTIGGTIAILRYQAEPWCVEVIDPDGHLPTIVVRPEERA